MTTRSKPRSAAAVSAAPPVTLDQPSAAPPPARIGDDPAPSAIDANGFDPTEFEWRPVPRRRRADGWTPEVQRAFIEALARTGVVERACAEVNMSVRSAYDLRNAPGGEGFARAWAAVLTAAADRLLDIAFQRVIEGEEIPVYDQDGIRTGVKWRYNTRLTMFLLRAYHPERFRHAHRDTRGPHEAPPPAAVPVADAAATLGPVTPADPHLLMPPHHLAPTIAAARAEAATQPREERDPYVRPLAPADHPRVVERARMRKARRARRDERLEDEYLGDDER